MRLLLDESLPRRLAPIVITKHGRPVAQLAPVPAAPKSSFGYMKNTLSIRGDVVATTGGRWSADSGDADQLQTAANRKPRAR